MKEELSRKGRSKLELESLKRRKSEGNIDGG